MKASLIDDFKHHLNTYMYKDVEDYINWDYFKAYENDINDKSKKSNLFELSKNVILQIEQCNRIDQELKKPKPSEKIIRFFFYPKKGK